MACSLAPYLRGVRTARSPTREPIMGDRVRLESLSPEHAPPLFRAGQGDPELWDFLPYGPFTSAEEYASWIAKTAPGAAPPSAAFVGGPPAGVASYLRITP